MFGTMVVIAIEASIISLEAGTAITTQMERMLRGGREIQGEANLMQQKFAALQEAFSDALANVTEAKIGQDLRSIIRANYERLSERPS
jgi:hypothetical protein